MSKVTIELPDHLRDATAQAAAQGGFSLDALVTLAVAEKLSAMRTVELLRREGAAGDRKDFDRFLAAIPNREPIETDRLPE